MNEHAIAFSVEFTVNGKKCSVNENTPRTTSLNAYLRYELQLPGTKAMCHEGGCGICVVSVTTVHPVTKKMKTFSVNSCLVLIFSCHGWDITTIEGLGNRRDGYNPIQKRMCTFNATQCGYCTPGWIMQMYSLLDKKLTKAELERSFGSNTCRCTGYRPILDTMKSFAIDTNEIDDIEDITDKNCAKKCPLKTNDSDWFVLNLEDEFKVNRPIALKFGQRKFYKVFSVNEVFNILSVNSKSSYTFLAGNTGKALYETYEYPEVLIDINDVASLKDYTFDQNLILGANMTLEETKDLFEVAGSDNYEFSYLLEFGKHLDLVAHLPVRNIGTLAGNLVMKHKLPKFQSDIFLLFEAVGAMVTLESLNGGKRILTMNEFLQTDLTNMIMVNILVPPSSERIVRTYKIMPRSQNALAIVNAVFIIKLNAATGTIEEAVICFGNITPDFTHAYETERCLIGKRITDEVLQEAVNVLDKEIQPIDDPPEESPETRKKLAIGLFYKFILNICPNEMVNSRLHSGGELIDRPISSGTQVFHTDPSLYPLNEPLPKLEALIQSSGEAEYVNDLPNLPRQVFGAFVLSSVYSGEIEDIAEDILSIPGVLSLLTAKDIPGVNTFINPTMQLQVENEELLADKDIKYHGQPVAIVVAKTEALAAEVAKKVLVKYKNVRSTPPVLTIDEARKDPKRFMVGPTIEAKSRGVNVQKVLKGIYKIEQQYHYYTEPMTAVVIPKDNGFEVYSATQWLDLTQTAIADCLNIKESDITVKVSRVGGGFGGKLSRSSLVSTACALVAYKMNLPCRFVLPLQTNMIISGRRLPCRTEYEVGVNDNGRIQYLNANILEDNGCSRNESILAYTLDGFSHCYNTDYWSVKSFDVYTDLPSNTFFRGPGTLEGISSIEHIMEHIAFEVQKDPTDVRLVNMRTDDNDLPELIPMFKEQTEFEQRFREIEEFNQNNRWMKKALTLNVMLFPIIYYGNYHALVSIYRGDGTVTVTTGGVEMGQGVNTKAVQVCAKAFDIPLECVSILPNYSFTAANNVFSGSSITSECICFAIVKACEVLKTRLQPVRDTMKGATWKDIVKKAGDDQIDLVASYMMNDMEPELKNYSVFAVNVLEVQLDVLIGRYEILRLDILEDVGLSANPAIDVGQVEGGLIQALGYYTSEKFKFDAGTGRLLTNRSLNYHVPLALDIPADFRVYFRYNSKNPKGVLNSKAVGEMGVGTAHSVTHALRKCINESRNESGYEPHWIDIDIPYTTESILEALDVKTEEFIIS